MALVDDREQHLGSQNSSTQNLDLCHDSLYSSVLSALLLGINNGQGSEQHSWDLDGKMDFERKINLLYIVRVCGESQDPESLGKV